MYKVSLNDNNKLSTICKLHVHVIIFELGNLTHFDAAVLYYSETSHSIIYFFRKEFPDHISILL